MPRAVYKSPGPAGVRHVQMVDQAKQNLAAKIAEAVEVAGAGKVYSCDVRVSVRLSKPGLRLLVEVIITQTLPLLAKDVLKAIVAEQVKDVLRGGS